MVGSAALDQTLVAAAPGAEITLINLYEFAEREPNFILLIEKGVSISGTSVGGAEAETLSCPG